MADPQEAREQFCSIAGVSNPTEAEHYLEAVDYNVERAIDLFYSNPPPPSSTRQEGAEVIDMTENDADAATAAALYEEDLRRLQEEPHPASRFEGLTEPSAQGPANPPGPAQPSRIEVPSDDDDEAGIRGGEDEEGDMLNTMAAQRQQSVAAAERAQQAREGSGSTTRQGMATASLFEGLPGALPTMFPGLHAPFPDPFGVPLRGAASARRRNLSTDMDMDLEDEDEEMGREENRQRGTRRRIPVQTPGQDAPPAEDPDAALARRLMEEEEAMAMPRPASPGPAPQQPGQEEADPQAADLHGAFDRHELEEARMLEASMLGIPYEPRLPTRGTASSSAAASSLHPEVGEQRSLRYEQDQAYEESLAADRAKEEAAQMAAKRAESEAKQAQEEAEASERAAAEEENRVKEALSRKAASLAPEPDQGEPDTVTIMVRWPDGTRQARRFRQQEPLQAVFDYVDTQHQGAYVKPGTYNLVNSYPRKAFSEGTPGTLADVGITSNTSLFLEPNT